MAVQGLRSLSGNLLHPIPTNPIPPMQSGNKPIHEVKLGSVRAAVWRDQANDKVRFNVSLSRSYKDGDKWKSSEYFGREDLPKVAVVVQKVYEWTFSAEATGSSNGSS